MNIDTSYFAAMLVGFLGGVHCVGMCGGIVGALSLGLDKDLHANARKAFPYQLAYNAGRLLSYTLAGVLMGSVGWLGAHVFTLHQLQLYLELLAATFMLALALYIGGWWQGLAKVEQLGAHVIWQKLEPYGRRFLPVRTLSQAFLLGLVWGWLPCGLVYSVLIWTITAAGPVQGGLLMLSFGLGTLPNLLLMGVLASTLNQFIRQPYVRQISGMLLVGMAGVLYYRALS